MVQCTNCQSNLEADAQICEFCGYNLSSQELEPSSNESDIRCYICNNGAEGSCSKCGKQVCKVHLTAMSSTGMNSIVISTSNLCSICAKKVSNLSKNMFKGIYIFGGIFVVISVIIIIIWLLIFMQMMESMKNF